MKDANGRANRTTFAAERDMMQRWADYLDQAQTAVTLTDLNRQLMAIFSLGNKLAAEHNSITPQCHLLTESDRVQPDNHQLYWSLAEAQQHTGLTPQQILHLAINAKVRLFFYASEWVCHAPRVRYLPRRAPARGVSCPPGLGTPT